MSKLITVFGATGTQGGSVIRTIIADPKLSNEFRVRAVTRDPSKPNAKALAEQGIELIQGDMSSPADVAKAVDGAHTVYLVTNFWDTMSAKPEILQGKIVTDACNKAGVKHLIFSSLINAAKATEGRLVNITHFDGKAEVEEYIRESGIPASFVMPGIFMTEIFSFIRKQEDGSFILATPVSPRTVAPWIDAGIDTGNFVRAALQHPPLDNANIIYAASDYYSFEQVAADFKSVIGEPLSVVTISSEMFKAGLAVSLPPDMVEEIYENLVLLEDPGYYAGADLTSSLELLSEKPVSLKEFFEKNRGHWE
ncbi:putative NmrA family transcriptional regulator [Penicillium brasilianum]|uniref:Putative NmrA family transcriptional regulator n=1 Tax=Penicillium brasilianum TaxID=104259 RepID=A0A1S9RVR1_PENBI|nr:putative NmrA family transcriptional regulator [Penicillium brasilianum]